MNVWRTILLFVFLGVVLYLLRETVLSKESFQTSQNDFGELLAIKTDFDQKTNADKLLQERVLLERAKSLVSSVNNLSSSAKTEAIRIINSRLTNIQYARGVNIKYDNILEVYLNIFDDRKLNSELTTINNFLYNNPYNVFLDDPFKMRMNDIDSILKDNKLADVRRLLLEKYKMSQLETDEMTFRTGASVPDLEQHLERNRDLFHYARGPSGFPVAAAVLETIPDLGDQLDQATFTKDNRVRISQYMRVEEKTRSTLEDDLRSCQSIARPEDIPADNVSKCGWWHVPDISGSGEFQPSYCVPGTERGPNMNLTGLPSGGTWFWSKDAAIEAEAKKYCKRATSCSLQDTSISCAFCEDKGYSIPYNRETGQILYGEQCTRLHPTATTCPTSSSDIACLTETTELGKKNCISTLMQINGIVYDKGLLHRYVYGKLATEEKTRFGLLLNVLNTRARWRSDILEINDIDPDVAGGAIKSTRVLDNAGLTRKVKKIVAATNSYDPVVKGIARLFVEGTPFQSSAYYYQLAQPGTTALETTQNNLALQDLQQEFRKAGCQAAGADYPKALPPTSASLVDHRNTFQSLYQSMNTEEDQKQEDAIRRCLNASYRLTPSASTGKIGTFCNEPGIEYLIFSPIKGPGATLIGRLFSPVGLLGDASSYSEANGLRTLMSAGPITDILQVGYVARTLFQLDVPSALTADWTIPNTGTYVFRVNGQEISTKPGDQAPAISYTTNQRTLLEIQYTVETPNQSERTRWGKPEYSYIFRNLRKFRLLQESYKPLINFEFANSSQDLNRIARLVGGFQYSPQFTGASTGNTPFGLTGNETRLTPRLRSSMIQIVDCTVFLSSAGRVFTLAESESYLEYFAVESNQLKYVVLNGNSPIQIYSAAFPDKFVPFGRTNRFVIAFSKTGTSLSVQIIVGGASGLEVCTMTEPSNKNIQGTLGFKRSLEIILGSARFETFKVYDRKDTRQSTEGFQNQSNPPVPSILLEDGTKRYSEEAVAPKVDASPYIPNTILKSENQKLFVGAQAAPDTTAVLSGPSGPCTYTPISGETDTTFRYKESYTYNQKFANAEVESTAPTTSLQQCFNACRMQAGCVGMSYASDTGLCTRYKSIADTSMVPQANTVSMIMPGQDKTLADMRIRTRDTINAYKRMREVLKKAGFNDANEKAINEIDNDLKSVEAAQSVDCLNAFLQKYTLNTK